MDIKVESIQQPVSSVSDTSHDSVEHLAIKNRFNIDIPTKEEDQKLSTIWQYVKSQGDERGLGDIIWEVAHLEQTLGAPALGETRLDKLHRYVSLRIQEQRIQEELKHVSTSPNIYR